MLEVLIGLAILPFALTGLLMIAGTIILTWRYIVAAIVLVFISGYILLGTNLDGVIKIFIVYLSAIVVFGIANVNKDEVAINQDEAFENINDDSLQEYIDSVKRFKLKDIKHKFNISSNVEARQLVDHAVKQGYAKPESAMSLYWVSTSK